MLLLLLLHVVVGFFSWVACCCDNDSSNATAHNDGESLSCQDWETWLRTLSPNPETLMSGCFSFVSLIALLTKWVFINSHFATKTATVCIHSNKQETTMCYAFSLDADLTICFTGSFQRARASRQRERSTKLILASSKRCV
ncbi:unnamed protein product [Polarella glacialis]|uniref:Secreted protein n=1 Tax=Polarella glacialis TaxID=89957 RepID=A0A813H712_POLGL|nr:unnamed protein product [Polarella glacialis]